MDIDFLNNLPSEILTNIFSKLPVEAIARSKCVCKPWLHLLQSNDFVNSHLAQSVPVLAVMLIRDRENSPCTIFELKEEKDLESHNLHYNQLTKIDFPRIAEIKGSANGLLFLFKEHDYEREVLWVCNPITRDYIEVCFPIDLIHLSSPILHFLEIIEENVYSYPNYGFGVSKISGEYKVVRISHDSVIVHGGSLKRNIPESECHVYTLGTGSWRRVEVEASTRFEYQLFILCVFFNGNLHLIASDSHEKLWISCFDLETERFSHFSTPPINQEHLLISGLSVLGNCLCLYDNTGEGEIVIWLMKEYGVEKSWTKEYVINIDRKLGIDNSSFIHPIKLFEDGDTLLLLEDSVFIYYSSKTGTIQEIDIIPMAYRVNSIFLTPSFVSLQRFGIENVISFDFRNS